MGYVTPLTGAQRVAKRRAALRAQGLRPRTFWLPDTSTPEFKAEAARFCDYLWERERTGQDAELRAFADEMADEALSQLPPYDDKE